MTCSVEGCVRKGRNAGLCTYHYGAYRLGLIDKQGRVLAGEEPDTIDLTDGPPADPADDAPKGALPDIVLRLASAYHDTGDERFLRALAALAE